MKNNFNTLMNNQLIRTLSFIFDNQTDHMLLLQMAGEGPMKTKHTGMKGNIGQEEGMKEAALRNIQASSGLEVSEAVLRGVVKTIYTDSQSAVIYFVYESSMFSGELGGDPGGRLKWVDILNVFNLPLEGLVEKVMPYLLDGESFFEGTIHLNAQEEVERSDIYICNSF